MNYFEKWLEGNVVSDVHEDELVVPLSDLKALLEEYVVLPKVLSDEIINKTPCSNIRAGVKRKIYKGIIKGFERG